MLFSQVVEGENYYLKIKMARTKCDKRNRVKLRQVDLEECALTHRSEQEVRFEGSNRMGPI